jgi:aryl-alcohol dehydrogenase-like predicted oxidoreductase
MARYSRREFLRTGLATGALVGAGSLPLLADGAKATDWITLGKSGVKVTRLAFGTGSHGGTVQRNLGQDGFTALVRHAYDRGVRFFETSDTYGGMHSMLGIALRGIPRESYRLMSKVTTNSGDPRQRFDELRSQANTDYFDIMLLHVQQTATWPTDSARWQDGILEAEARKIILSHGASVHGLPALRQVPANKWLQVAMIRMNHTGTRMDGENPNPYNGPGNVTEVVSHVIQARQAGLGVISMKLAAEGTFNYEDRQKAMRFAFRNAGVDSVTLGYKSPAEVDEAIDNLNLELA